MYTIVAASQKGGSGKTTLSGHLAVEAERAGTGPVALIDTDPQGSLAQWWNARAAPTPHFVKAGLMNLGEVLSELRNAGFRLAVIDTPPAITASISQVVAFADLVIVPTRPSPHDLRAVGATVDIVDRRGKPLIFVVNAAMMRARITGETAVALSQHGTVAPVTVHNRVDFAASMVDGRTVGEVVPDSASAREISELWIYIQHRLSRLTRDPKLLPDVQPQHFSVGSLLTAEGETRVFDDDASMDETDQAPAAEVIPLPKAYAGPERRQNTAPAMRFGGPERRGHTFGRRISDPAQPSDGTGGRK